MIDVLWYECNKNYILRNDVRWLVEKSQLDCKSTKAIEVIYKDFSKAFASLQPSKLLSALSNMQVPGSIIQLHQ